MHTLVVQHPVRDFLDAWAALNISQRLGVAENRGEAVSVEEFFLGEGGDGAGGSSGSGGAGGGRGGGDMDDKTMLRLQRLDAAMRVPQASPDALRAVAREGVCGHLLVNRLACRLGLDFYTLGRGHNAAKAAGNLWTSALSSVFTSVMLAEHMEQSLVLFRQIHCWAMVDVAFVNAALWRAATLAAGAPEAAAAAAAAARSGGGGGGAGGAGGGTASAGLLDKRAPLRKEIESLTIVDFALYVVTHAEL